MSRRLETKSSRTFWLFLVFLVPLAELKKWYFKVSQFVSEGRTTVPLVLVNIRKHISQSIKVDI